jgi:phage shock protein E
MPARSFSMNVMAFVHTVALILFLVSAGSWASDITWIDVRSAEEFAEGHVATALNIPHEQIDVAIVELKLQPDDVIYLYCRSGRRSGIAKDSLEAMGYTQVTNIGSLATALQLAEEPTPK